MVTQRHIAELAGVDRSTVSCAIRGTGSIRPEIREKILNITRQLGYVPNANATALRKSESNLIGVVASSLESPYHASLIQCLGEQLMRRGYRMVLSLADGDEARQREDILQLLDQRAAGVIVCTIHRKLAGQIRRILRKQIPMVLIGPANESVSDDFTVGCDLSEGGFLAGRHLVEIGRRRLVCLVDSRERLAVGSKAHGFRRAVADIAQWVEYLPYDSGDRAAWMCDRLTDEMMERFPDVDGVFALSDAAAIPMVRRLLELGRKVPEDVAVVGFDDLPQARYAAVPLTTIHQPIARYAHIAVNGLMSQLKQKEIESASRQLPCNLIVRKSTDPDWEPSRSVHSISRTFSKGVSP